MFICSERLVMVGGCFFSLSGSVWKLLHLQAVLLD